jgi:hypothetical protein
MRNYWAVMDGELTYEVLEMLAEFAGELPGLQIDTSGFN